MILGTLVSPFEQLHPKLNSFSTEHREVMTAFDDKVVGILEGIDVILGVG